MCADGRASSRLHAVKDETETEAYERRMKESMRVEERVVPIYSDEDFRRELEEVRPALVHNCRQPLSPL